MATTKPDAKGAKKASKKGEAKPNTASTKKATSVNDEDTDWQSGVFNTTTPDEQLKSSKDKNFIKGEYLGIGDGETAVVRFLDDEPLTFYQHSVFDSRAKSGKGSRISLTCPRKGCPLCDAGDKPRYVGAYRVIHLAHVDAKGRRTQVDPTEKIFIKGVNALAVLDRKNSKKPLSSVNMEIERIGEGFDTQYIPEFTDDKRMPKDYKRLPSASLKDFFKVSMESLDRLAKVALGKSRGRSDDEFGDDDDDAPKGKGKRPYNDTEF